MLPTREEALKLIRDGLLFNPGPWGKHCLTAAHCAEKIASACGDMDVEKAYILGLLHDIGRKFDVTDEELIIIKTELAKTIYDEYDRLIQLCDCLAGAEGVLDIENRKFLFSKWIKQDALFCAISAENMEHFIFLLEKLGFEVKQGKHIAVKVPGMKRFKRLDTISEDLCRESLEAMFRYGDASLAALVNRAVSLLPARKAVFSPYQRKYYARMYRLRLAEKNGSLINLLICMSRYGKCMSFRKSIWWWSGMM